jgi:DNA/RNA-binding domain of Phe-tRNA-synthetase-like protein
MTISISEEFQQKCPDLKLGVLQVKVQIKSDYPELLSLISTETSHISTSLVIEDISKLPAITAARKGYKAVGKDPARYRLSAEALLRRTLNGKGLYKINNVVDALNLVSLKSGISIGGYDYQKIAGEITLGIGKVNEPYQAIGRGELNIEFLPVLRDQTGAFGSPTSDSVRTMVTADMQQFLMIFFSFDGLNDLKKSMTFAGELLEKFANGEIIKSEII